MQGGLLSDVSGFYWPGTLKAYIQMKMQIGKGPSFSQAYHSYDLKNYKFYSNERLLRRVHVWRIQSQTLFAFWRKRKLWLAPRLLDNESKRGKLSDLQQTILLHWHSSKSEQACNQLYLLDKHLPKTNRYL